MRFNLKGFKKYVKKNFPSDHPLQVVQYEEEDVIEEDKVILAKIKIWLNLAELKR